MPSLMILAAAAVLFALLSTPLKANDELSRQKPGFRVYYVNSVYNIWNPNTWSDMLRYRAFVDESKYRGFDSINVDIGWTTARPDGTYDFSLFDKQVSYAISKGMYVWPRLNCTLISGRIPYWFSDDMCMRDLAGKIYQHQNGRIPSITHPVVLREMARFCKAVARHCDRTFKVPVSGADPIVCMPFSFTPTLETEYFFDGDLDYSQSARDQFRKWVRAAYRSLADLNAKWGTAYKTWADVDLVKAHPTAKELYFESRLQILLDLIGDTVHKASPRMKIGMQTGCIWDIPRRRVFNVTPLLRKMDWILVADSHTYPHAFSTDYTRCSAPGKLVSNEFDAPSFGGKDEERLDQATQTYAHGGSAVFASNWSLEEIKNRDAWKYLEEIPKIAGKPAPATSEVAIYLSPWDLINGRLDYSTYCTTYNKLSDNGAVVVDVIPDAVIAGNPRVLARYKSIYLPANYTIPDGVRAALLKSFGKLIIEQPDKAGTLDIYGRATIPLAATPKTVKVTDCGAVPNDSKDDAAAVLSAIKKCRGQKLVTILFPKGRYDFFAGTNPARMLFIVDGIDNLTIDGQGSEFIMHGATGIFSFIQCKNLTVKNFTVDWDRVPFSQGRVLDVKDNYFDVDVSKDYPISGNEPIEQTMEYDPKTGNLAKGGWWELGTVEKTELLRPQVLRVCLKDRPKIRTGMTAVMKNYYYYAHAFLLTRCSNVRVENVDIYTAFAFGFMARVCNDLLFERVRIVPRPGTDRLLSTAADGVHLSGNKGTVTIKDCQFARTGDDAINFNAGKFLTIKRTLDDHTVVACHDTVYRMPPDVPDPGDAMEFTRAENLLSYATATVKSAELIPDENSVKIVFDNPLPTEFRIGDVMADTSRAAKGRILDCTFNNIGNHGGRGMLLQSRDIRVMDCSFRNIGEVAIWVMSDMCQFKEAIQPYDVWIVRNTFTNDDYGPRMPCVGISGFLIKWEFASTPGIFKNIKLEGNTFRGLDNCAVLAAGVDGLVIKNNVVERVVRDANESLGHSAFNVIGSRNVLIEGNQVDPARQGKDFKSALQIGPGCDKDTTVVGHNKGF